jgi:hypothetical protein
MMGGVEKALMVDNDERERRHTELSSSLMLEVQTNMMVYLVHKSGASRGKEGDRRDTF